jgi:hypothetical protein
VGGTIETERDLAFTMTVVKVSTITSRSNEKIGHFTLHNYLHFKKKKDDGLDLSCNPIILKYSNGIFDFH